MSTPDLIRRLEATLGPAIVSGVVRVMREHHNDRTTVAVYRGLIEGLYIRRGGSAVEAAQLAKELRRFALEGVVK
jgi:hypothetical protein